MKRPEAILAGIAREHLHIPTLATRRADILDFHDVAVWQVEAALKAAFDAGAQSVGKIAQPQGEPGKKSIPAALPTPLVVAKGMPLLPGKMYLRLYHGRTDPGQEMEDWGFDGPTFGPLACYVHTYCSTFRIHADGATDEIWLEKHDDMIRWEDCYYGDMEVFIATTNNKA